MKKLGNRNEVEEYFENDGVSQSQLKMILSGVPPVKDESKLYYEEKGHFIIGSGVDVILTQGTEEFNEQFHVSTIEKPTPVIMSIIKKVFDKYDNPAEVNFYECIEDIQESCNYHSYYLNRAKSNPSEDKRIEQVLAHSNYWDELVTSNDKIILSIEENFTINDIVDSLLSNPNTSYLFEDSEDTDVLFQLPIYFEHEELQCKALLDLVRIDHSKKTIYPYDIKTIGNYTNYFQSNFRKFRYDFQAAFYSLALMSLKDYKDYTVAPFSFIVESTIHRNPLVYTTSSRILNDAYYGIEFNVDYGNEPLSLKKIGGIAEAIKIWKWHKENGFDKNFKAENGVILLDRL